MPLQTATGFVAPVFIAVTSRANNLIRNNLAGGNWSNSANWSPDQVPGTGDTALIASETIWS